MKVVLAGSTNLYIVLIDKEDLPLLKQYNWYISMTSSGPYVVRRTTAETIYLHKIILATEEQIEVDHISGNTLDNRRRNLRICSHQQNTYNTRKQAHTTSMYKGITWNQSRRKWQAQIHTNHTTHYLGLFTDEREAARKYNEAATRLFGDFARLNRLEGD